jgi:hypothetical protein
MLPPPRTLVAVVPHGPDAHTHVLYYSDGTVVGFQPAFGRVVWQYRLAPDTLAVDVRAPAWDASALPLTRPAPDTGVPIAVAAPERRGPTPGEAPPGRRPPCDRRATPAGGAGVTRRGGAAHLGAVATGVVSR